MQTCFQVEYIILTEDAFPCSKVKLIEDYEHTEEQKSSCCRWFKINEIHVYEKLFSKYFLKESQDDDGNGIEKEDILSLEDNVIEELDELRVEMEGIKDSMKKEMKDIKERDASTEEKLKNILCILEKIQQKV